MYPINLFVQKHCHTFFSHQVVATDADLAEPYNLVVYDTAGTARAEQYFDVDVTSGIIFVKRDLRFPTSQTSEMFVLDIQVGIAEIFISITPLFCAPTLLGHNLYHCLKVNPYLNCVVRVIKN